MNALKAPKILFFVDGMAPSSEDMAEAAEITGQVCFRNARAISAEGSLEACDGVAGKVPPQYSKLPTAKEAAKAHTAKVKAMKQGDIPAPNPSPAETKVETEAKELAIQQAAKEAAGTGDAGAGVPAPGADANVVAPGAGAAPAAPAAAWKAN